MIHIADLTLERKYESDIDHHAVVEVEVVPLNVSSVLTESKDFIPLISENELPVTENVTVIEIKPAPNFEQFTKDVKPASFAAKDGLKFERDRFRTLAIVAIPRTGVHSGDPYTKTPEIHEGLVLVPFEIRKRLPDGARFFGVVECSVESIAALDAKNDQKYRLGFFFPNDTEKIDWLGQAITRQKHWERGHVAEPPTDAAGNFKMTPEFYRSIYPPRLHLIVDSDAAKLIKADRKEELPDGNVRVSFYDQDDWQRAKDIQAELIARRREEIIADRDDFRSHHDCEPSPVGQEATAPTRGASARFRHTFAHACRT
jgi:hypothetical protein